MCDIDDELEEFEGLDELAEVLLQGRIYGGVYKFSVYPAENAQRMVRLTLQSDDQLVHFLKVSRVRDNVCSP